LVLSLSLLLCTQHTSSIHPYADALQATLDLLMYRVLPFHASLLRKIWTNMNFSWLPALGTQYEGVMFAPCYSMEGWIESPYISIFIHHWLWWVE
jgi:hypothetical protein